MSREPRHRARQRLAALAAAAVGSLLVVSGCGVPAQTEVRVDGPPAGTVPLGTADPEPPPGPDEATTADELVDNFLQAAAADPDNAVEVLREFVHSSERDSWQPDPQVYVARVEEPVVTRGAEARFELTVRRVAQYRGNGVFEPLPGTTEPQSLSFSVTTDRAAAGEDGDDDVSAGELAPGGERFRIVDPPPYVLLDDRALLLHFHQRPVYFWDSDQSKLVPDLRWLPSAVPTAQRPQYLVDWLVSGPAPWLSTAATALPGGITREGNVVPGEGSLEVRLTAPHDEADYSKLDAQLWWTLWPELEDDTAVTVLIDGEQRQLSGRYRSSNAVPAGPPASFTVVDGEIWQYLPDDPVALAALGEGRGSDIVRAAVTRDTRSAALVVEGEDGEGRLVLAQARETIATDLAAEDIGRPVWLNNPPGETGLIPANGQLYQFSVGSPTAVKVELADLPGRITDVAVAPDGRRLALVSGGRLYVAQMTRAGDVVGVGVPRPLQTTAEGLDGVAFIRENWLAIVGTAAGQSRLYELTVDGALERELLGGEQLGTPSDVGNVVGYPADPLSVDPNGRGPLMYEADGLTWRYAYPHQPRRIDATDLHGFEPPEDDEALPSPRAPFFVD